MKSRILFLAVVSTLGAAHAQDVQFINGRGPSGWEGETICSGQNSAQWQPGPNGTLVAVNPQATLNCKVYLANNNPALRAHEMEHVRIAREAQAARLAAASGNMGPAATANQTFNQRTSAIDAQTARRDAEFDRVTDHGRVASNSRTQAAGGNRQNYQQRPVENHRGHGHAIPRGQAYYGGSYAGGAVVYESSTVIVNGAGYNATYTQQGPVQYYEQPQYVPPIIDYSDPACSIAKYQALGRCF